jgi:uncharacterized protein DUF3618
MDQDESEVGARVAEDKTPDADKTPEQIRREIEDTRQELGDTAAALAAKTDVKARAKEKVEGIKQTVSEKKEALASSSAGATGAGGQGSPLDQVKAKAPELKAKAQQNPIPTAAIAAFIGGFVFGRLTSR